jgi:glutamyl-tRNA synthetase
VEAYAEEGILPEALLNYLALLGWSIDGETTLFDRATLVSEFDLTRVSKSPAVWDPEKLEWMNGAYIRELPAEEFAALIIARVAQAGLVDAREAGERLEWFSRLAPLLAERVKRLDEIPDKVAFFFTEPEIDASVREKVLEKEGVAAALSAATAALAPVEFTSETIEEALRTVPEVVGIKPKVAFQAVRAAVTGQTVSLPLFESLELLGKERTLARIAAAQALLR